jgi:hypothetical protein
LPHRRERDGAKAFGHVAGRERHCQRDERKPAFRRAFIETMAEPVSAECGQDHHVDDPAGRHVAPGCS